MKTIWIWPILLTLLSARSLADTPCNTSADCPNGGHCEANCNPPPPYCNPPYSHCCADQQQSCSVGTQLCCPNIGPAGGVVQCDSSGLCCNRQGTAHDTCSADSDCCDYAAVAGNQERCRSTGHCAVCTRSKTITASTSCTALSPSCCGQCSDVLSQGARAAECCQGLGQSCQLKANDPNGTCCEEVAPRITPKHAGFPPFIPWQQIIGPTVSNNGYGDYETVSGDTVNNNFMAVWGDGRASPPNCSIPLQTCIDTQIWSATIQ